jgi:RNA polymerase sigma-70 factor (ECF subfamily)
VTYKQVDTSELEKLHAASFGWALSCCRRDRTEAEEVLQTVYLKILEGKARYRGESNLKTWLFAVIRKTAITEHRKRLLRSLKSLAAHPSPEPNSFATEPAKALERSEAQQQFQRALARLPARQREVLHLVFYEDLSLREAANVMGVSIGSARQHYERGKKHLRASLNREEVTGEEGKRGRGAKGKGELDYGTSWRRKENPGAIS